MGASGFVSPRLSAGFWRWMSDMTRLSSGAERRCAVISNPAKVSDEFHQLTEKILRRDGWVDTVWLETSADDPGRAVTKTAVAEQVGLVIAAGGDGTIRLVADGLAGTGIPMGLIPAGTGNLLARNLGVPLDEVAALEVAVAGRRRRIDLVELTVDGGRPEHFAVMAGIGVDAMIMDETDPRLKDAIGWGAYFFAAGKALRRAPVPLTFQIDGRRPAKRRAMVCLIGNVGTVTGNLTLIPGSSPTDGLLDLCIASPHRILHWVRLLLRLITRRPQKDDRVDQYSGKTVTVTIHGAGRESYQLDGDVIGVAGHLVARIKPGALTVCVPPASDLAEDCGHS
jgi:diacylglycerol kinase (ATP)